MRILKRRKDGVVQGYHVKPTAHWHTEFPGIRQRLRLIAVSDIEPTEDARGISKIESIKASGEIQKPILVHGKYQPGEKYQLIDGHHRYYAALQRGDRLIPAYISLNRSAHRDFLKRHQVTIESPEEKVRRLRAGYSKLVRLNAVKIKEAWEKGWGEKLAWNEHRLKGARERKQNDSYPRVVWNDLKKSIDIEDGRHRIAAAAEKGHNIIVTVPDDFPQDEAWRLS